MSTDTVSTCGRFRPESARDFSQRSRRLSRWLGLPYQRSQELLARIYGYSGFHELRRTLERPGKPGPFDESRATAQPNAERALRIARVIAEFKGVSEIQLSPHEHAVAAMGLFYPSAAHRATFNALGKSTQTRGKSRRLIIAPLPSHPSLPTIFVDVECAEDEGVAWVWTSTPMGQYVSGYRLIPRGHSVENAETFSE